MEMQYVCTCVCMDAFTTKKGVQIKGNMCK